MLNKAPHDAGHLVAVQLDDRFLTLIFGIDDSFGAGPGGGRKISGGAR